MPTGATIEGEVIKVKMAGIDFGKSPAVLETLLGSCVGIAMWDSRMKLGGLAHVVLPDSRGATNLPGKYADTAVVALKRGLLASGASPNSLTAKITGGATMFGQRTNTDIGQKNIDAVTAHLRKHGIRLAGQHVGGETGRIIRFSLDNGSVDIFVARKHVGVI